MNEEKNINRVFLIFMTFLCTLISLGSSIIFFIEIAKSILYISKYNEVADVSSFNTEFFTFIGFFLYFTYFEKNYGKYQTLKIIYMCLGFSLIIFLPSVYVQLFGTFMEKRDYGILFQPSLFYLVYISFMEVIFFWKEEKDEKYKTITLLKKVSLVLIGFVILFILYGNIF